MPQGVIVLEKNVQMEARVWSRVMGQNVQNTRENEDISSFLRSEYAALAFYRCLQKKLCGNRHVCRLICLSEDSIKYLKALYYVENGCCFKEKCGENVCISCVCDALREQYKKVQNMACVYKNGGKKWEKIAHNRACQGQILLEILQGMV